MAAAIISQRDYRVDKAYGADKEDELLDTLCLYYRRQMKKLKKMAAFDFTDEAEEIFVELKSRRNSKDKYPTTIVGLNKVEKAKILTQQGKEVWFWFYFTDGLYYIRYEEEVFRQFSVVSTRVSYRADVGRHEITTNVAIPVEKLLKF